MAGPTDTLRKRNGSFPNRCPEPAAGRLGRPGDWVDGRRRGSQKTRRERERERERERGSQKTRSTGSGGRPRAGSPGRDLRGRDREAGGAPARSRPAGRAPRFAILVLTVARIMTVSPARERSGGAGLPYAGLGGRHRSQTMHGLSPPDAALATASAGALNPPAWCRAAACWRRPSQTAPQSSVGSFPASLGAGVTSSWFLVILNRHHSIFYLIIVAYPQPSSYPIYPICLSI